MLPYIQRSSVARKKRKPSRRKEEAEEAYLCCEGMSALFEERRSAPIDEEGKGAVCEKEEQDNKNLVYENKPCHGPTKFVKIEGVYKRRDTSGEGSR